MCASECSQVSILFLIVLNFLKHTEIDVNRLLVILAPAIPRLWSYLLHSSKDIPLFSSFDPFTCRIILTCTLILSVYFTQNVFAHVYSVI